MKLKILILLAAFISLSWCQESTLKRRRLSRFIKGHPDNDICWDRHGSDGFFTVIDTHNHFRPFGGPGVEFNTYLKWMTDHGVLFSTMFGIGQLLKKSRPNLPDCCYYLHCPTYDYKVVPDPTNDMKNAQDFAKYKNNKALTDSIHLTLSATYVNLQEPRNNTYILDELNAEFPEAFNWAGEINVYKHALAGNGFFDQPRVTVKQIQSGAHDALFNKFRDMNWAVTLHCDIGCDNYDAIPITQPIAKGCFVPLSEIRLAKKEYKWWQNMLGPHYGAFFNDQNEPNPVNFKKIQHLQIWDAILTRYPDVKVVWAHMGMSKELKDLHPLVHKDILVKLLEKHPNLYADVSWDVLPQRLLMNFKNDSVAKLLHTSHVDFDEDAAHLFNHTAVAQLREEIHNEVWLKWKDDIMATGSNKLGGPSYAMAMYLDIFNKYSDRFVTGTDFVSSMGTPEKFPGLRKFKNPPTGCLKSQTSHARQLTDTSSMNMFLDDQAFKRIVLGENYFNLIGKSDKFAPPPLCSEVSGLSEAALVGIIVAALVVLVLLLVALGFLIYTKCIKK